MRGCGERTLLKMTWEEAVASVWAAQAGALGQPVDGVGLGARDVVGRGVEVEFGVAA